MCQTSSSTPLSDLLRRGFAASDDAAGSDLARAVWRQGLELDRRNRTLTETLRRLGVEP